MKCGDVSHLLQLNYGYGYGYGYGSAKVTELFTWNATRVAQVASGKYLLKQKYK